MTLTSERAPLIRRPTRTHEITLTDPSDLSDVEDMLRDHVTRGTLELPPLPGTAAELHRLASDPRATLDDVGKLVEREANLASRVMRVANSPVLRGTSPVTDLRRAITRLGIAGVRDLAMAVSMGRVLRSGPLLKETQRVVTHSFAVACGVQWVCKQLQLDAQYGFLCGLMHDIGSIALLSVLAPMAERDPRLRNVSAVGKLVDGLHAETGGLVLQHWRMPSLVADVARWHHRPHQAGAAMPMTLVVAAVNDAARPEVSGAQRVARLAQTPGVYQAGLTPAHFPMLARLLDDALSDEMVQSLAA
ncbi:MAG: HDOD domain-containing protein [Myxococcota bacterium]